MPRRRDPKRKSDLLARFVDYVLKNGLADLSLRPAASALGTSPQILLYYFGSKEELISQAIAEVRMRQAGMLSREISRGRRASASDTLWRVWRWFIAKERAPFSRLFFEVYGLALQHPDENMNHRRADSPVAHCPQLRTVGIRDGRYVSEPVERPLEWRPVQPGSRVEIIRTIVCAAPGAAATTH